MYPYNIPIWKEAPFVRVIIPFIAGIVFSDVFSVSTYANGLINGILIAAALAYHFLPLHYKYRLRKCIGVIWCLLCFQGGQFMLSNHQQFNQRYWYGHHVGSKDRLLIQIESEPELKPKTIKFIASVSTVVNDVQSKAVTGKLMVYCPNDIKAKQLRYGDELLVSGSLKEINNTGNPGGFDYKKYLSAQQIYHQLSLKDKDFIVMRHGGSLMYKIIFELKRKTLEVLQKNINAIAERGVAEALMIGYKNELDRDLVQQYTNTGVVHIIAISGLHLGLIYFVLVWIFNQLPFLKTKRFFKAVAVISLLWIFALMTGASASVLRSAVMFTCIAIGKSIRREASIYNALASSAFILLCYNPFLLWDVGFQLSYLAIIGIVWLQKPIYAWFSLDHFIVRKVWELTSITLAAQVFTTPICLYYFHQFPNYFIISNLIAVPLSTFILFEELLLVIVSGFDQIALLMGQIVEKSIRLLNSSISFISRLPFSLSGHIYADLMSTMLLYLFILLFLKWIRTKEKIYAYATASLAFAFSLWIAFAVYQQDSQAKIIVYNTPKRTAVDIISNRMLYSFTDTSNIPDSGLNSRVLNPSRVLMNYSATKYFTLSANPKYIQLRNKKILLISGTTQLAKPNQKIYADFLVLSSFSTHTIDECLAVADVGVIIAASSNSNRQIKQWQKDCSIKKISFYSIPQKGAFVYKWIE